MHHSCGNGSCCSPSKLWRQIQTIVRTGNEQDFVRLCGDGRAPHVARVLLSQRLVNDPAMYPASNKHRVLQLNMPHQQLLRLFGTSARDLNGLQMALFLRNEVMAKTILEFLQDSLSPKELYQFVNHSWGQKNSSLHLAAYWGMVSLVQLLLECGADTTHRNARQRGPLDGCTNLACIQLLQSSSINTTSTYTNTTTTNTTTTTKRRPSSAIAPNAPPMPTPTMATPLPRTSMLLKKAVQHVAELPMDSLLTDDHYQQHHHHQHRHRITPIIIDSNNNDNMNTKPTLVFSSSTSSSSLSSLDEPPSPGSPLLFLSSKSSRQPPTPDLVLVDDDDDDDDTVDYHEKRRQRQCWTPPSPMTPPMTPLSPTSGYHGDHDDNFDHEKRNIASFSPNPMDHPTPICHRPLHPPFPLRSPPPPIRSPSVADDDDDNDDDCIDANDDHNTPNTPDLLPSTPTSLTSIMCNRTKKKDANATNNTPKIIKSVRFSPDIVLLDACVRGDVGDLKNLMKQQQKQHPAKATSMILREWQQQHFASTPSTASSSMLHIALLHRQEKMARYLVSLGADVNATDQDGWTPLHYAATLQLWSTVDALAHHPDILLNMKTNNGLKVYDCPRALVDQRKCRTMIERAAKKQQQQQSLPKPFPQQCLV